MSEPCSRPSSSTPGGLRAGRAQAPFGSLALAIAGACLWAFAFTHNAPSSSVIWDDAFMFVRYADHLLLHGGITWNESQGPVWGPTSLGYLALVTGVRTVLHEPQSALVASSFLAGGLFVALSIALTFQVVSGPWSVRLLALAWLLFSLSYCGDSLGSHLRSGMDTTFAMAYLSAYLASAYRLAYPTEASRRSREPEVLTGLLGGVAFIVRPDLVIYAVAVPLSLVTSKRGDVRRAALRAGMWTSLSGGALWAACSLYFKTPVPLSFYVKSLSFDPAFTQRYRVLPALQLGLYARAVLPLCLPIAAGVFVRARAAWQGRIEAGVALATLSFVAFYRFDVVQVMHYSQRFYFPTLPALIFLAMASWPRLTEPLLRIGRRSRLGLVGRRRWLGALVVVLTGLLELRTNARPSAASLAVSARTPSALRARIRAIWPGLNAATELPNDLVIATSEVGIPGALNPGKTVLDTSGLNDSGIALGWHTAAAAVLASNADLVYLHRDYAQTNQRLLASPAFAARYVAHDPASRSTPLSVFLRRDGRYFLQLARAIDSE